MSNKQPNLTPQTRKRTKPKVSKMEGNNKDQEKIKQTKKAIGKKNN